MLVDEPTPTDQPRGLGPESPSSVVPAKTITITTTTPAASSKSDLGQPISSAGTGTTTTRATRAAAASMIILTTENFVDDLCVDVERELMMSCDNNDFSVGQSILEDYRGGRRNPTFDGSLNGQNVVPMKFEEDCDGGTVTSFESRTSSTMCSVDSCTSKGSYGEAETPVEVDIFANDGLDEIEIDVVDTAPFTPIDEAEETSFQPTTNEDHGAMSIAQTVSTAVAVRSEYSSDCREFAEFENNIIDPSVHQNIEVRIGRSFEESENGNRENHSHSAVSKTNAGMEEIQVPPEDIIEIFNKEKPAQIKSIGKSTLKLLKKTIMAAAGNRGFAVARETKADAKTKKSYIKQGGNSKMEKVSGSLAKSEVFLHGDGELDDTTVSDATRDEPPMRIVSTKVTEIIGLATDTKAVKVALLQLDDESHAETTEDDNERKGMVVPSLLTVIETMAVESLSVMTPMKETQNAISPTTSSQTKNLTLKESQLAPEAKKKRQRRGKAVMKKIKRSLPSVKFLSIKKKKQRSKLSAVQDEFRGEAAATASAANEDPRRKIEELLKHRQAAYLWSLSVMKAEKDERRRQWKEDDLVRHFSIMERRLCALMDDAVDTTTMTNLLEETISSRCSSDITTEYEDFGDMRSFSRGERNVEVILDDDTTACNASMDTGDHSSATPNPSWICATRKKNSAVFRHKGFVNTLLQSVRSNNGKKNDKTNQPTGEKNVNLNIDYPIKKSKPFLSKMNKKVGKITTLKSRQKSKAKSILGEQFIVMDTNNIC